MNKQDHKHPRLSLSACSIPVLLAVVGYSSGSSMADVRAYVDGSDAAISRSTDVEFSPLIDQYLTSDASIDELADEALSLAKIQSMSCWICMAPDDKHFWVSDGQDGSISTYRFTDSSGNFELVSKLDSIQSPDVVAVDRENSASAWVDLQVSDDGSYLYQVFGGSEAMAVYEIDGGSLTLIELIEV